MFVCLRAPASFLEVIVLERITEGMSYWVPNMGLLLRGQLHETRLLRDTVNFAFYIM
jgi:hypothetical protein